MADPSSWSLIVTAPNVEFKVAEKLTRFEIEFLLIKHRIERVFHGKRIVRLAAAFPRYLFVCVHDAWEKVLAVNGVVDFVRIGLHPATISDEVIGSLRCRLDAHGVLPIIQKSRFAFGQKAMVQGSSVYSGHQVIYQYPLSNGRAYVLQQWFGTLCNVEVDESDLISIDEHRSLRNRMRKLRRQRKRRNWRSTDLPSPRIAA